MNVTSRFSWIISCLKYPLPCLIYQLSQFAHRKQDITNYNCRLSQWNPESFKLWRVSRWIVDYSNGLCGTNKNMNILICFNFECACYRHIWFAAKCSLIRFRWSPGICMWILNSSYYTQACRCTLPANSNLQRPFYCITFAFQYKPADNEPDRRWCTLPLDHFCFALPA